MMGFGETKDEILKAFKAKLQIDSGEEIEEFQITYSMDSKHLSTKTTLAGKRAFTDVMPRLKSMVLRNNVMPKFKEICKNHDPDFKKIDMCVIVFDFKNNDINYNILYLDKNNEIFKLENKF